MTTRAVATFAKGPSAPLRATRAPGQPRSGCSAAAASAAAAHATASRADGTGGGGEGGSRPNAVPLSKNHVAAGRGGGGRVMTEITNGKGSVVRRGRPRAGQGRDKRRVYSQTPIGPWDFSMHPYQGWCRRPCFKVRIICREAKAVQYTAGRLEQTPGNRRGDTKKIEVTAVLSLDHSSQTDSARMPRNNK